MSWTHFWDMHSGGGQKLEWDNIFIEAPEAEAKTIFYNRFGRNPERVTCTCCGEDYAIDEDESLEEATAYQRGCSSNEDGWLDDGMPLADYIEKGANYGDKPLVIYAKDITPEERGGDVPEEGNVWR